MNKNVRISINFSLMLVPKGLINNIPALVHIMAWRRSGDKPLSELMLVILPTHICVARPQWVKCFSSRLAVVFAQYIEAKYWVENEDVVGAAPRGYIRDLTVILFQIIIHFSVSAADMWNVKCTFTSGGKHQIWYIRFLGCAESTTIRWKAEKSTEAFRLMICLLHVLFY